MNIDQAMGQVRPMLKIIGTVVIAAGLAKFFGFGVPVSYPGLELAVAGYLLKSV